MFALYEVAGLRPESSMAYSLELARLACIPLVELVVLEILGNAQKASGLLISYPPSSFSAQFQSFE